MAQFAIPLRDIEEPEYRVEMPIPLPWLRTVLEGTDVRAPEEGAGTVSMRLYKSGPDVIVSGVARASLVVDCSRCLEDVQVPVEAELELVMSEPPDDRDPDAETELSDSDDLGREYFRGDTLVFDDIIRDHLLLELPMQPICTDPPCPEWVKSYLTTAAEAETQAKEQKRQPDPRLAALQSLRDKLKKN